MVGLGRLELPTYGLGNRRSIHLSYSPESDPEIITDDSGVVPLVSAMRIAGSVSHPGSVRVCALRSFHLSYVCYYRPRRPSCSRVLPFGGRHESHPSLHPDCSWCPDRIADRGAIFHSGEPVQTYH